MKILLGIVLTLLLSSFAQAKALFTEYTTTLLEVNQNEGVIQDSDDFFVGSSGIVMHAFDEKTSSIISHFDVIKKENGKATIKFSPFKMLTQGAFPDTGVKPAANDKVIVNYLYDRALIVAPNQAVYTEIFKKPFGITWVHPDIVASYLAENYKPNPDKATFQAVCNQNTASLIVFAIKEKAYFVDCHNFNVLMSFDVTASSEVQLPFYSRIHNIDSAWLSFGSSKIANYDTYYTSLIGK